MPYVEETPTINLTLKNGAVWNVTGDSTLTNLENDSFVNLSNTDRTGTSLTAQTLSGTGTMVMDLDWNSNGGAKEKTDNSDYLNVTESATGTQALVTDKASCIPWASMTTSVRYANQQRCRIHQSHYPTQRTKRPFIRLYHRHKFGNGSDNRYV